MEPRICPNELMYVFALSLLQNLTPSRSIIKCFVQVIDMLVVIYSLKSYFFHTFGIFLSIYNILQQSTQIGAGDQNENHSQ